MSSRPPIPPPVPPEVPPRAPRATEALAAQLPRLYERVPLGMQLGLERIRDVCARMGNPERAFEAVHVAGTNGKGSVAAMVESVARAAGLRTGLYSSPHLCRFAERIQIAGVPIADDALADLLKRVLDAGPDLSFFEVATASAFLAFREAGVELAILEVGIGGRHDATNVIPPPRAAAITRIALDHTAWLGETTVAIAREKAGIAKPGMELVLGPMSAEVKAAIDEVAGAAGARTFAIVDDAAAMQFGAEAELPLAGDYQRVHAAIAHRIGASLGASERAIRDGIAAVRWPGRLERIVSNEGDVLLDAAHNPDGAESLARYVASLGLPPERVALVFGTLADKQWPKMIDPLAPLARHIVYVPPRGRAATDPRELANRHAGQIATSVGEALATARAALGGDAPRAGTDGLVIVCGSIFLVGEARALLLGLPRDPPVAL